MVTVRVEYYGVLEDVCGTHAEEVTFADGPLTVAAALEQLVARHRALAEHCRHVACALDDELVRGDARVRDGAVLALLPPVSGG